MTVQDRGGAGEVAAQLVLENIRPEPIESPSPSDTARSISARLRGS
jgi:hypothetical protein